MRQKPRNVVGDEQMWSGIIPGLGFLYYVLGVFTVPIETFLRRDFGERYFTRNNFIGGWVLLIIWSLGAMILGFLNLFNPLAYFVGANSGGESWMPGIIKWYFYFGIGHFLYIWWKDIIGKPEHSFKPGRSWLRPIGRAVMFVANLVLNPVVRLIFAITPKADKERLPSILPVLRDEDTFTERFIEPLFVFIWAFIFMSMGQFAVGLWLLLSSMALVVYTGFRHEAERGVVLDYRDQMIEARAYREATLERLDKTGRANAQEKVLRETAREVEKNPEVMPIIERKDPALAEALKRINPKLKGIVRRDDDPDDDPEAMAVAA